MNETTQPAVAGPVEPTVRHQPLPDELLWELAKAAANTDEGSGRLHYNCDKAWAREFARLVAAEVLAERRSLSDDQVLMIGRRAMDKCLGTEAQHLYIAREVERAHGVDA